jgi:hypothetical protein
MLPPPVQQGIVRPGHETLHSFAIFDLDAGPVTITLSSGAERFIGMHVVNPLSSSLLLTNAVTASSVAATVGPSAVDDQ